MDHTPHPKNPRSLSSRDVPLVIKDGLRELRFVTRLSAQRWMDDVEDVLSHVPKLGLPMGAATKTASQLFQFADRVAVDLLSNEKAFRRADFRLPSPGSYLNEPDEAKEGRVFIKTFYWALKQLLKLKSKTEFLVLEESVFQAFRSLHTSLLPSAESLDSAQSTQSTVSGSSLLDARIIYALYNSKPLVHHDGTGQDPKALAESIATLTLHVCVTVVLASEITSLFPNASAQGETREALVLADEICGANLENWEQAILHRHPIHQLAQEMEFSMRHI